MTILKRKASIDIGSNSVLLLIGDFDNNNHFTQKHQLAFVTGLGRGLDKTKTFSEEAIQDTLDAFREIQQALQEFSVDASNVIATATEASRVATNAQQLFEKIYNSYRIKVNTISADREAYLTMRGVLFDYHEAMPVTILDIGGASTEFISVNSFNDFQSISLPVGSVRSKDWHIQKNYSENMSKVCKNEVKDFLNSKVIGVAGTVTTIACMFLNLSEFSIDKVQNYQFTQQNLDSLIQQNLKHSPDELLAKYPVLGKRKDTIIYGAILLNDLMLKYNFDTITVSTYGLRYGSILEG